MSVERSRIEGARRRAAAAKQLAAAGAAVGFLGVLLLARASHPGQAASSSGSSGSSRSSSTARSSGAFSFGSGNVAPSTGAAPQTDTHVS